MKTSRTVALLILLIGSAVLSGQAKAGVQQDADLGGPVESDLGGPPDADAGGPPQAELEEPPQADLGVRPDQRCQVDWTTTDPVSRCHIETTGAGGITGYTDIEITWHQNPKGTYDGSICVDDTLANGSGVVVNLNGHKGGEPEDNDQSNYVNSGTFATDGCGDWRAEFRYPERQSRLLGPHPVDFVYVNYADSHNPGCPIHDDQPYCYQDTFRIDNPVSITPDPILFVHGYNDNEATWNTFVDWFAAAGHPRDRLQVFSYDASQSNVATADEVKRQVEMLRSRTGARVVDIVAHSMGSLSSRYYLRNLGGIDEVDDWVSLGGPNHGTDNAWLCDSKKSCQEMKPGSTFLQGLNGSWNRPLDETPGNVNYVTVRSSCDPVVLPNRSVILEGATNIEVPCRSGTSVGDDPHMRLRKDRRVFNILDGYLD